MLTLHLQTFPQVRLLHFHHQQLMKQPAVQQQCQGEEYRRLGCWSVSQDSIQCFDVHVPPIGSSSPSFAILILHVTIVYLEFLHFSPALATKFVNSVSSQHFWDLSIDVLVSFRFFKLLLHAFFSPKSMSWTTSFSLHIIISFISAVNSVAQVVNPKRSMISNSTCGGRGAKRLCLLCIKYCLGLLLFTLQMITVLDRSGPPLICGTDPSGMDWVGTVMRLFTLE